MSATENLATAPAVVRVTSLRKSFGRPHERVHTLKERVLHPLTRSSTEEFVALDRVGFEVRKGEFFGIVGRNGSGKSTLLKCIAGILAADHGRIELDGRLSTFIELGVGFNPDLPARDNVILNATLLGLSPRDAASRVESVIAFAELEEFRDLKLKNYSSGMEVRLAFSVMLQVDADILLIDEVLAVGDAAFQQKCFDEFVRIREEGRTVLLVTHDMGAVQRFCDRALLLERGRVVDAGPPERIAQRYLEVNFERGGREAGDGPPATGQSRGQDTTADEEHRMGDGRGEVVDAWFEGASGRRSEVLHVGERVAVCLRVVFHEDVEHPLFGVNLLNAAQDVLLSASNLWSDPAPGMFRAGEDVVVRVAFDNVLAAGRYWATPAVARKGGGALAWIDRRERFVSAIVTGARPTDALVDLPFELRIER